MTPPRGTFWLAADTPLLTPGYVPIKPRKSGQMPPQWRQLKHTTDWSIVSTAHGTWLVFNPVWWVEALGQGPVQLRLLVA